MRVACRGRTGRFAQRQKCYDINRSVDAAQCGCSHIAVRPVGHEQTNDPERKLARPSSLSPADCEVLLS
jgi:hypothetical protein